MTTDQTVILLSWLISFGVPILVAIVTRIEAASFVKVLTNLGGTTIATALSTIVVAVAAGHAPDWFTILFTAVTSFIVSGASYAHIWNPTGVIGRASLTGPQ